MFAGGIRLDLTLIKWKLQFVSKRCASLFLVVMATSPWGTSYNAPFQDIAKLPIRQVWTLFSLCPMRCKVSEILKHLASQITTYKCLRFRPPLICLGALHLCWLIWISFYNDPIHSLVCIDKYFLSFSQLVLLTKIVHRSFVRFPGVCDKLFDSFVSKGSKLWKFWCFEPVVAYNIIFGFQIFILVFFFSVD